MKTSTIWENKVFKNLIIILFWLGLWQILAMYISEEILLVSPLKVLQRIGRLSLQSEFWVSIFNSLLKINIGLLLSIIFGLVFALISFYSKIFREFMYPLISIIRATPVASIVILLLVWIRSENLSIIISFFMGMPIIYQVVLMGLETTDPEIIEMADSFKVTRWKMFKYIYWERVKMHLVTGIITSVGLIFKSGIAAEVIGTPKNSIGYYLYTGKVYLDIEAVLAWTLVVIVLSYIYERIFRIFLGDKNARV